jgi:two-component system copper resistance phosphate regulon response regulator CusR
MQTFARCHQLASNRQRILIAEDEQQLATLLREGLHSQGYTTTVVADGKSAYQQALSGGHDLLLLDLGLPVMDGFTALRELRAADCHIPVIILTARGNVADTVAGLSGGADDYLSKPFRFAELVARIRRRLRDHTSDHTLRGCGLELDLRLRTVRLDDQAVQLTAREFALAETLVRHNGRVLSREQLLSAVWGDDPQPQTNVVEVYIRSLRRKLGHGTITTVVGKGYRLNSSPHVCDQPGPARPFL